MEAYDYLHEFRPNIPASKYLNINVNDLFYTTEEKKKIVFNINTVSYSPLVYFS